VTVTVGRGVTVIVLVGVAVWVAVGRGVTVTVFVGVDVAVLVGGASPTWNPSGTRSLDAPSGFVAWADSWCDPALKLRSMLQSPVSSAVVSPIALSPS
jgi:hypothetical protein